MCTVLPYSYCYVTFSDCCVFCCSDIIMRVGRCKSNVEPAASYNILQPAVAVHCLSLNACRPAVFHWWTTAEHCHVCCWTFWLSWNYCYIAICRRLWRSSEWWLICYWLVFMVFLSILLLLLPLSGFFPSDLVHKVNKALALTSGLASSFLHPPADSWQKSCYISHES